MYHFLLGGYDLEMLEIKKILDTNQLIYTDKRLAWGATIDDYYDIITSNPSEHFVGIELSIRPNSFVPKYYIDIDHHNEKSHLPASIEQIADLLNIKLSRHQQLVAANDKGYIPAMEALDASVEEIQNIRRLDRQTQGVTEEMEKIAEQEIKFDVNKNGVRIIKTSLDKFSPIVDRLQEKKILIYNAKTLNYYGQGVQNLALEFKNLISTQKAYHGGGENGYFGTVTGVFSETELNVIISNILDHVAIYDS